MLEYRIAYEMVPDQQRLADKELADFGDLRALPAVGSSIEMPEKLVALRAIEALRLDNDAIARESGFLLSRLGLMKLELDRDFLARNMQEVRAHFGRCVETPTVKSAAPD
jgi:hypothetical protein